MKKAIIICAGGMTSSLVASKATQVLREKEVDIQVDAGSVQKGRSKMEEDEYDLYLISPQTKSWFKQLKEEADRHEKKIILIPADIYSTSDSAIEKISEFIKENI